MAFGPLVDLRPSLDTAEFRALLLPLVGWRGESEFDQLRLERVIQGYRSSSSLHVLGFESHSVPIAMSAIEIEGHGSGILRQIAVRPEWRRQGVGRALLHEAQLHLGLSSISAETDRSAVGFYERCGFCTSTLGEKYPGVERFLCRN